MLEGLDKIDWAGLEHAYGPAGDIPQLIRDLISGDPAKAEAALQAFFGNIWHQGTVYSASAPAVPFLAEALAQAAPAQRAQLLTLLASLAQGHGYVDVHQHLQLMQTSLRDEMGEDGLAAQLEAERRIVRDTTLAVMAEWARIAGYLEAPERAVRIAALFALSLLAEIDASDPAPPDHAAAYLGQRPAGQAQGRLARDLGERATERLARPDKLDPAERAAWLRALFQCNLWQHPLLQAAPGKAASPAEAFVLTLAHAMQALKPGGRLPDDLAEPLAALCETASDLREVLGGADWPWEDDLEASLLPFLSRLNPPALEAIALRLEGFMRDCAMNAFYGGQTLELILGETRPDIPGGACPLPPGRRALALAFLAKPLGARHWWFWSKSNGNARTACAERGAPHDRKAWLSWLGAREKFLGIF